MGYILYSMSIRRIKYANLRAVLEKDGSKVIVFLRSGEIMNGFLKFDKPPNWFMKHDLPFREQYHIEYGTQGREIE
jgi:hypothetical protein